MEDIFRIKKIPYLGMIDGDIKPAHKIDNPSELSKQGRYFYTTLIREGYIEKFDAQIVEKTMETIKKGRFSDLPVFDPPEIPRFYKQIMPTKKPQKAKK